MENAKFFGDFNFKITPYNREHRKDELSSRCSIPRGWSFKHTGIKIKKIISK